MQAKVVSVDLCIRCSVLIVLSHGASHGYELSKSLEKFKLFNTVVSKPTSVYSYLRKMEEERLISSEWAIEDKKKPKRLYSITEAGRLKLGELIVNVAECGNALFEIVENYRRHVLLSG